jgi:hypothetical protein
MAEPTESKTSGMLRAMSVVRSSLAVLVLLAGASLPARADAPFVPVAAAPSAADQEERARLAAEWPVIELVTMGIGSLIWERHGHIVLCVRHPDPRRDLCYNYGIGDFRRPLQMGWGFFRGTNSFWAGADSPADMLAIYRYTDRTIWSQALPLTAEQKQKVIAKLQRDVLEENKYYSYDHFWDNCTTRVRDILDDATGGQLRAQKATGEPDHRTIRALAREGFYGMRLPLLITDLAMGRVTDRQPTYYERMFLPQYMRQAAQQLWGAEPRVLYQRRGPPELEDGPSGRGLLALVLLALGLPVVLAQWRGRFLRTALTVTLLPQVLLGLAFWALAVISPLSYVRYNESCLIFLPLDFLMVVLPAALARKYARARVGMLVVIAALLAVGVLKQPLWAALLGPLVPALAVGFWPRKIAAAPRAPADPKRKPKR